MEFVKKTRKVGNSAGVLLPKKLLGAEVKIIVINKPFDLRKEVFKLVENCLQNIVGIYILNKNPPEVLAISENIKRIIETGKIKLNIVPLDLIKKDIKTQQLLRQKLMKAEIILNQLLLEELRKEIKENFVKSRSDARIMKPVSEKTNSQTSKNLKSFLRIKKL